MHWSRSIFIRDISILSKEQTTLTNVRFYTNTRSPCGDLYIAAKTHDSNISFTSQCPHTFLSSLSDGKKLLCHVLNDVVDLRVSSHRFCGFKSVLKLYVRSRYFSGPDRVIPQGCLDVHVHRIVVDTARCLVCLC